ncbi:hypothetical protein AEAC466_17905 [Asticcacaulis sp. AC466]|uniref:hypothetical protein n=1 Tax=Asticcacaulis sp. AC466 TaxID=1282362 RepID=UPI0003C3DB21|nr:hypothetical protein [Asticcacaulis sp. AC466]ESQ82220.1 hypothetical protein AEAC466_17905 [Asticcacaulis sp. AC466]
MRTNELEIFPRPRRTATKIILPFDPTDLKLGGASVFVGQRGFDSFCKSQLASNSDVAVNPDVQILGLLDSIPALDPFLVRELLARNGFKPAHCYLKISPADIQRMIGFANAEIERLVKRAFGSTINGASLKLATKILSNELDQELMPLKHTLRLSDAEFSEGIFSWRGFLYFKWRFFELQEEMRTVISGLSTYQPAGKPDDAVKAYLEEARPRLGRSIGQTMIHVGRSLAVYDQAYAGLVDRADPSRFRTFLLDGPKLFYALGESIAILGHIASFWQYRMGQTDLKSRLHVEDYADILMDFEDSLSSLDGDT